MSLVKDFAGNKELLRLHKTAFLCSRKIPASAVLKCYDWAIDRRNMGECVISGFHSTIEKDVLHYLLKGQQPIIVALARGLKDKVDTNLRKAFDDGRLLIITPFTTEVKRVTQDTAKERNRLMIEMADVVTIGHLNENGSLRKLLDSTIHKPITFL